MKRFFQFLGAFALTMVLADQYLNLAEIALPLVGLDSEDGESFMKNKRFVDFDEGFIMGKTNSLGFLSPDFSVTKDPDEYRIILLGDSYIAGRHVFQRHHFRKIMEDKLKERTRRKVQVLNFGKEAVILKTGYYEYLHTVKSYQPDLILLFLQPGSFRADQIRLLPFVEMDKGQLVENKDFKKSLKYKLYQKLEFLSRSSLVYLAIRCCNRLKVAPEIIFDKFYAFFKETDVEEEPEVQSVTYDNNPVQPVHREILEELSHDPRIILVTWDLNSEQLEAINDYQFKTISLNEPLDELKDHGIDPNYWPITNEWGHWNQEGHKAIGRFLGKVVPLPYKQYGAQKNDEDHQCL